MKNVCFFPRGMGVWKWGKREIIYLSLHCHHIYYTVYGMCVCARVCSAFFVLVFFKILLYVIFFGRTMLYICIEYHI